MSFQVLKVEIMHYDFWIWMDKKQHELENYAKTTCINGW